VIPWDRETYQGGAGSFWRQRTRSRSLGAAARSWRNYTLCLSFTNCCSDRVCFQIGRHEMNISFFIRAQSCIESSHHFSNLMILEAYLYMCKYSITGITLHRLADKITNGSTWPRYHLTSVQYERDGLDIVRRRSVVSMLPESSVKERPNATISRVYKSFPHSSHYR